MQFQLAQTLFQPFRPWEHNNFARNNNYFRYKWPKISSTYVLELYFERPLILTSDFDCVEHGNGLWQVVFLFILIENMEIEKF